MKHIFRRRSKQPTVHWQQRDSSIPSARAAIRERTVMLLPSPSASGPAPAVATAGGAMHSPPRVSAPLPPSAREPASELSYVGERATQSAGRAHPAAAAYPHAEQHPDSATWPARAHMVFTSSRECSPPPFLPSESSGGPSDLPTDVGAPESLPFVVYRRHEEFWFEDGNVILVARGGVGFRVYKGVLCEAGTAWGPMFSRHDGPMHEGVPVIFLTDDPGNLTLVMRRLMPPQRMGAAPPSFLDITTLSACVRLGFKYGMDTLITHCRDFLLDLFPCDFDEWLDLEGRTFLRTLEERAEFLVPLVNLAHLLQYWYFVPAALLLACTVPEAQLVSGFDLPDGTTERLCAEDYARVAHLHSELRARLPVMLWELLDEFHPPSTCVKGPGECSASVKSPVVAHEIREWVLYCARNSAHPLPMWGWLSDVVYRQGVCRVCHAWLENEWKVKLKEVWLELPDILGLRAELPHWPEHADPEALTYSDADVSEDADRPISEGGQEGAGDSSRNPRDLDDRSFAGDHMAYGAQDAPADQSGIDSESGGEWLHLERSTLT
ncbi:hypothetical protein BD309DRAFT_532491 [Dichomitus squalens]|nr:hypothetical protein BD309DRAFT_532491 [Dichomitus squalens]